MKHIVRFLVGLSLVVTSFLSTYCFVEYIKPNLHLLLGIIPLFILYGIGWFIEYLVHYDEHN